MLDMVTKRQALAAFCKAALELHRDGLAVETRYRRQTEPTATRRTRVAVMGDPCYYLEVLHQGPQQAILETDGGALFQARHRFRVSLFFQYEDAEEYDASSQALYDQMAYGTGGDAEAPEEAPGLITALARSVTIGEGADRCIAYLNGDDRDDVVPLDESATETAHLLTFSVDVEG